MAEQEDNLGIANSDCHDTGFVHNYFLVRPDARYFCVHNSANRVDTGRDREYSKFFTTYLAQFYPKSDTVDNYSRSNNFPNNEFTALSSKREGVTV